MISFKNVIVRVASAAAALAASLGVAQAALPVLVELQANAQQPWGGPALRVKLSYSGPACTSAFMLAPLNQGDFILLIDGVAAGTRRALEFTYADCSAASYKSDYFISPERFPTFGVHTVAVQYTGSDAYAATVSSPVTVEIAPEFAGEGFAGPWKASRTNTGGPPGYTSSCQTAAYAATSLPATAPPGVDLMPGALRFDFQKCSSSCSFLCPPYVPSAPVALIHVEVPPAAAGKAVWIYGPAWGRATAFWHPAEATVADGIATVAASGNAGDGAIAGWLAFAPTVPDTSAQDLWWGGSAESGWGFSLAQSGEQLFGVLYTYRDNGTPVWLMMPGGTWDATHRVFSGSFYGAIGSWFGKYDASRLQVGPAAGTACITFATDGTATLDYTIGAITGRKAIQRYAPAGQAGAGPRTGLWWAGTAQNGWGVFVQQKGTTNFAVWFTYDASGAPTWYAMSGGVQQYPSGDGASGLVQGTLGATTAGPWLGATFNPATVSARKVGDLVLNFQQGGAGLMAYSVDGVNGSVPIYRFPF